MITNSFACTASASSTAGLYAVFLQVCPICMAGPWVHIHSLVSIILLALVLVHDTNANWRAQCDTELCAGLDLYTIFLVSWGRNRGLARPTARHLGLYVALIKGHAWRAAVDYGTDAEAVRLSIAEYCQKFAIDQVACIAYVVTLKFWPKVDMVADVCWIKQIYG